MESIKKFIEASYGSGYGDGYGSGNGYGDGSGNGNGYGDGSGDGDGYGSGYGIEAYNGQKVYVIDKVETILTAALGNLAKGYILEPDLTLTKTYVAKSEEKGLFAHGESIRVAIKALGDKIFEDMDEDERISEFIKAHRKDVAYTFMDLFEWHHKLTGSCEQGRSTFVKSHNISMDKPYTVIEFCEICENSYGGEIIRKLKERYNVKS